MRQAGRVSAAALAVVPSDLARPDPPPSLTEEQAQIWRGIVAALPATWFGVETWGLLEQYCRHATRARSIARAIQAMEERIGSDDFDYGTYDRLLKQEKSASSIMATLSSKMRLNQQGTYDKTHRGKQSKKPQSVWDTTTPASDAS